MNPAPIPPQVSGSLEDWLQAQVARHADWFAQRPLLLDVGAYHGDFSRHFIDAPSSPFRQAILFEPNPDNLNVLQKSFAGDNRFRVEAVACADRAGNANLFCQGERYTGSLLAYEGDRPGPGNVHPVAVTTLDQFLAESDASRQVGMIKIDTQGNDLRVLQGATRILRTHRPWLVVEMLATPRFVNQARPVEVMAFLEGQKYFMAAQFNEYYTASGWLAWFDASFVPSELFSMDPTANLPRPTVADANARQRRVPGLGNKLRRLFQSG
ncbi:MAG TPA: FkbM family methyltransferase [Candidatus Saccharimonadales bacterium]|jgi:FkbM family methyltransferase|nr:FkbM family methyltransferase [Candidatus Saccharimonadales bacterium]